MPPKTKTPIKKTIASLSIEERRKYKLAHYYASKEKIQLERITTGILNGTRKSNRALLINMVSRRTMITKLYYKKNKRLYLTKLILKNPQIPI